MRVIDKYNTANPAAQTPASPQQVAQNTAQDDDDSLLMNMQETMDVWTPEEGLKIRIPGKAAPVSQQPPSGELSVDEIEQRLSPEGQVQSIEQQIGDLPREVGTMEKILIGGGQEDLGEKILRRTVTRPAQILALGAARGMEFVPKAFDFVWKYGAGAVEQAGYEIGYQAGELFEKLPFVPEQDWLDGGYVDDWGDLWSGNTIFKWAGDRMSEVVKNIQDNWDVKDRSIAESAAMYIVDYSVPIAWWMKPVLKGGQAVGKKVLKAAPDPKRIINNIIKGQDTAAKTTNAAQITKLFDETPFDPFGQVKTTTHYTPTGRIDKTKTDPRTYDVGITPSVAAAPPSGLKAEAELVKKLEPFEKELAQLERKQIQLEKSRGLGADKSLSQTRLKMEELSAEIGAEYKKLADKHLSKLAVDNPFLKIERGDRWWDIGITLRPDPSGKILTGAKYKGLSKAGNPIYEKVLYHKFMPRNQSEFMRNYNKVMTGQSIIAAGGATAIWEEAFKGTELEGFKHLAGFGGALFTPTVAATIIMKAADWATGTVQTKIRKSGKPGAKFTGTDMDQEWSLPGLMLMATIASTRAADEKAFRQQTEALLKSGASQDEMASRVIQYTDVFEKPFTRKIAAMSRGVPFYRALFGNKDIMRNKVIDIDPDGTPLYAVDLLTAMHTVDIGARTKFGRFIMSTMDPEYLDQVERLSQSGMKLDAKLKALNLADKTETFVVTIEMLQKTMMHQIEGALFAKLVKDGDARKKVFGLNYGEMANIYELLRLDHGQVQSQLNFIRNKLDALAGGDAKVEADLEFFTAGARKILDHLDNKHSENFRRLELLASHKHSVNSLAAKKFVDDISKSPRIIGEDGFDLASSHGMATQDGGAARDLFGQRNFNASRSAAKNLKEAADDAFEFKNQPKYREPVHWDEFRDALEAIRNIEIEGIGVQHLLKDKNKWQAFGSSGPDLVDNITAYARFTGIEESFRTGKGIKGLILDLDEVADSGIAVTLNSSTVKVGDITHELKFAPTDTGHVDIKKTMQLLKDQEITLPNGTKRTVDGFLTKSGLNYEGGAAHYLKRFAANLKADEAVHGYVGARADLEDIFPGKLTLRDLHALRSNLSNWANNHTTFTTATTQINDVTKSIDELFDAYKYKEVQEANFLWKRYKDGPVSQTGSELARPVGYTHRNEVNSWELGEYFLTQSNMEAGIKLFNDFFADIKDVNGKLLKDQSELRTEMRDILDSTLVYAILHDTKKREFLIGSESALKNLEAYNKEGLISDDALRVSQKYSDILKHEKKLIEDKAAKKASDSLLSRIQKLKGKWESTVLPKSALAEIADIKDTAELYKFFVSAGSLRVGAKPSFTYEQLGGKTVQEMRADPSDLDKAATRAYGGRELEPPQLRSLRSEAEDAIDVVTKAEKTPEITKEQLDVMIKDMYPKETTEVIDNLFDVFSETVFGLKAGADPTKRQIADFKALRRILVHELVQRVTKVTEERQSMFVKNKDFKGQRVSKDGKPHWKLPVHDVLFGTSGDLNVQEFGDQLTHLWPILNKISDITGETAFQENLETLFKATVLMKANVPQSLAAMRALADVPTALTTSSAFSRIYSGLRGVVSWRYLAAERVITAHKRAKALAFNKILTDPEFAAALSKIVTQVKLSDAEARLFRAELVKTLGGRIVIYNKETQEWEEGDEVSDRSLIAAVLEGIQQAGATAYHALQTQEPMREIEMRDMRQRERREQENIMDMPEVMTFDENPFPLDQVRY